MRPKVERIETSRDIARRHCYVVMDDDLERLWNAMAKFGPVKGVASCSNGQTIDFDHWEGIGRDYNNHRDSMIVRVELTAGSSFLVLSKNSETHACIRAHLETPGTDIKEVAREVEEVLDGLSPWYRPLHAVPLGVVLAIVCFALWVLSISAIAAKAPTVPKPESDAAIKVLLVSLRLVGLAALIWTAYNGGKWLQSKLFPDGYFALVQGKKRYERRKWISGTIFSLLMGLIVAAIRGAIGLR